MAKDMTGLLIAFVFICIILLSAFWPKAGHVIVVKYDCSIAEISPDFPPAVQEACRKRESR